MRARLPFVDTRPLRDSPPFRDLWIGTSLSGLGGQIATVAVLAQVWDLTGSPVGTGTIGLATGLPMVLFGLLGGALADSLDRHALVRATTTGQLLAAAGLCAQALANNRNVPLLLALVAAGTACGALGAPARRTFPVRLLPADQVAAGLALTSLSFQATMLTGPALAGLIIARWDLPAAYAAQAAATAISLLTVLRLPPMRPQRPDRPDHSGPPDQPGASEPAESQDRSERAEGWGRVIGRRPTLWGSLATDLAATLLAMPIALFPLVNEARFGGDPQTLGLFLSAVAVGGTTAGLLSGTVTRRRRSGLVQLAASGVWGLALAGFGLAGPLWLALGCLAIAGAADTVSVIVRSALIQCETPDAYRGRVSAVEHVIGVAGPELGNFRGGLLASLTSAPVSLVVGGLSATLAVGAVAATNAPLRAYRTPPATPPPAAPPAPAAAQAEPAADPAPRP